MRILKKIINHKPIKTRVGDNSAARLKICIDYNIEYLLLNKEFLHHYTLILHTSYIMNIQYGWTHGCSSMEPLAGLSRNLCFLSVSGIASTKCRKDDDC